MPASKRDLFVALSGVAMTVTIVAFDATIISTIMPQVAQTLGGLSLYAWVGTGYFLACAVAILIFGRLGDLYGRKRLMLWSLILVALGSALSGLSQSMPQLIAFRVLQGVGGGMMIATAFAAPADLIPDPKQRVRWLVMLSVTFAMASGVGPVLGGLVTQTLGWRAAFFLIPVTASIAFYLILRFFPSMTPAKDDQLTFDWLGAILLFWVVAAPLIGLEFMTMTPKIVPAWAAIALMLSAVVAGLMLLRVERRASTPIFPLRILQTPQMRYLNLAAFLAGAVMFVLIFYIPLLLQDVFGWTPTQTGLVIVPLVVGIPIGSIINGQLWPLLNNPQRLMVFGSGLLTIGCVLALTFSPQTSFVMMLAAMTVSGIGLGFLLTNFTVFGQTLVQRHDVGMASALVQTTRAFGSAVGTALVGIVIAHYSIALGLRIGLIGAVIASVTIGWLASRVKMPSYASGLNR
jgi:EmrB/QacA subfamily drug resistance transporter